jgi:hypothetical protein
VRSSLSGVNEEARVNISDDIQHEMLTEHARGDSYRTIGARHGVSHEYVRQTVIRAGRRFVDGVELDLYVAWKLTQQGRETEAEWPALVVPHSPEWSTSIGLVQWLVDQLRQRDLDVHVRTQPTPNGSLFMLMITALGGTTC